MADKTKIEWTDASWTPIRARNKKTGKVGWHCEHATTGCEFCYAEGMNKRLGTGLPFKPGHRKDIEIFLDEEMLTLPLRWKKPRMIFVCSMTDLFADFVPDAWIDRVFAVMALAPQHTFQVLTKRAKRMRQYFAEGRERMHTRWLWAGRDALSCYAGGNIPGEFPLKNVWLGVSAERQQEADERIRSLLDTPAAIRFVSAEPLLGPIDLTRLCILPQKPGSVRAGIHLNALKGNYCESGVAYTGDWDVNGPGPPVSERRKLDWVIVGGESGAGARPMHPVWARELRDQCKAAGVPFFFKQWGVFVPCTAINVTMHHALCGAMGSAPHIEKDWSKALAFLQKTKGVEDCAVLARVGKKAAGRLLDGVEYNEMPGRSA